MNLEDKSVLVTGADGFIGSHLVECLKKMNARIRALAYYNSFNSWGWLESIENLDGIEVISGDIRDSHFCDHLMAGVDIVFNLAALIAIPYSYIAPDSYVDTNVKGTLNICQAAKKNGCRVIHTSTSEVYGTAQYVPIDEAHPLQPQSPYSASKIGAEQMALSFYHAFELPVTIARPFNTYGPRQSARAVIPSIIGQIADGKKEIMLGDLRPTRDFNFVEDTSRGLIRIAECDETVGEIVNIGSGSEISIENLVALIKEMMHSDIKVVSDDKRLRPEASEVFRLCCDNSKLVKLTGFTPEYDLKTGLQRTIDWFTLPGVISKYKMDMYNV